MATVKKQHRPSVASIPISTSGSSTVTSPKVTRKGGLQQQQQQQQPPSSKTPTAGSKFAVPNGPTSAKQPPGEEDLSRLEPDQMFARFAVAEVRALQKRLRWDYPLCAIRCTRGILNVGHFRLGRADADSKQEELRLMVGCVDHARPLYPRHSVHLDLP